MRKKFGKFKVPKHPIDKEVGMTKNDFLNQLARLG